MDIQQKIKRLERNKKYCENFSQANNYKPLFIYHYDELIKNLKGENNNE